MTRRFEGDRLVVASHNAGKVREIGDLLAPFSVATVSVGELGLPAPDETETTFEGNAAIKALAAASAADCPALSDDSGLSIDALGGEPGVYAADWAETANGRDFGLAMRKVKERLMRSGASEPWTARFTCALCLAWPDGHTETFLGHVEGRITWPPRGEKGFGYDPIFIRTGETRTFGEIEPAQKHAESHRAQAFSQLIAACFREEGGRRPHN